MLSLLRLFKTFARQPGCKSLQAFDTVVTHWRVWPGDIDAFGHMTNARYQTLMDLARVDFLLRCKLFKGVLRRRWTVPVGLVNLHFRKALKPFERFEIHTRIVHWDERWFYFQQDFYRAGDAARPVATGYVKTLFAGRQGAVPTAKVVPALAGRYMIPPDMPAELCEAFQVKPMAPLLPASPLRNQYCSFADARSCSGVVLGKPKNSR